MKRRAALVLLALACGDGTPPTPSEPTGEYALQAVGIHPLPYRKATNLDGSYEDLIVGSLKVLSRNRLLVTGVVEQRSAQGALLESISDSVIFTWRRNGELVLLTFDDPLGPRSDTLDVTTFQSYPALRARSTHYRRSGHPEPMLTGAVYVKTP